MYPYGAQLNSVSVAYLADYGCTVCYLQTYGAATTSNNISSCTGPYLFVGGRATSNSTFTLGAFDSSTSILTQTPINRPHQSNGVYWYFTQSKSFGFSRNARVIQYWYDVYDLDSDGRLSWILYGDGGARLGSIHDLYHSIDYMKAIYNCPAPTEIAN